MDLMRGLSLVFMTSIIRYSNANDSQPLVQSIVDYMKENLPTYQVTLMVKSPNELGPFTSGIVKLMMDEFSSVVIDTSIIQEPPTIRVSSNLWERTADQSKLKVGIIELHDRYEALKQLLSMLEFIVSYSNSVLGKCIILLINGDGRNLEPFLKLAWSYQLLDFTIIEWVDTDPKKTFQVQEIESEYEVFVHTFNPFQNKYSKDLMTTETDVLPNKLKNLHGYPLRVNVFEDEETEWDRDLMQYLSDTLNFTIVPQMMSTGGEEILQLDEDCPTNMTNDCQPFDFIANSMSTKTFMEDEDDIRGIMDTHNTMSSSRAYFPEPYEYRLTLFQRRVKVDNFSTKFFTSCIVVSLTGLLFKFVAQILKLDRKTWSIESLGRALMGASMESRKQTCLAEKILIISLYLTSGLILTFMTTELINMYSSTREILKFKTLQELAESDVNLHVSNHTRTELLFLGQKHPVLQKIANSTVIVDPLVNYTANATDTSIYGKLWCGSHAPFVASQDRIWYHTTIEEVIKVDLGMLKIRRHSPYKSSFEALFRNLMESGRLKRYTEMQKQRTLKQIAWKGGVFYTHHGPENDKDIETPLELRLRVIIIIGYIAATIALIIEICYTFFRSRCLILSRLQGVSCEEQKNIETILKRFIKVEECVENLSHTLCHASSTDQKELSPMELKPSAEYDHESEFKVEVFGYQGLSRTVSDLYVHEGTMLGMQNFQSKNSTDTIIKPKLLFAETSNI